MECKYCEISTFSNEIIVILFKYTVEQGISSQRTHSQRGRRIGRPCPMMHKKIKYLRKVLESVCNLTCISWFLDTVERTLGIYFHVCNFCTNDGISNTFSCHQWLQICNKHNGQHQHFWLVTGYIVGIASATAKRSNSCNQCSRIVHLTKMVILQEKHRDTYVLKRLKIISKINTIKLSIQCI